LSKPKVEVSFVCNVNKTYVVSTNDIFLDESFTYYTTQKKSLPFGSMIGSV
jgi:hypothetical protein